MQIKIRSKTTFELYSISAIYRMLYIYIENCYSISIRIRDYSLFAGPFFLFRHNNGGNKDNYLDKQGYWSV